MSIRLALLAAAAMVAAPAWAAIGEPNHCAGLLPSAAWQGEPRALAPEDLVRLRDVGPVDPAGIVSQIVALSPDRRKAAFQLRRADSARNGYCLAIVVVDLASRTSQLVDEGGELMLLTIDPPGRAGLPTGIMLTVTPQWSPDGRWLAFLKRVNGTTQVWRAAADGSGSAQLTNSQHDLVDFKIGADGATLIYASRPGLDRAREDIKREGRRGFHYDERFAPGASNRPFPPTPIPREAHVLVFASGRTRTATPVEAASVGALHLDAKVDQTAPPRSDDKLWISAMATTGGAEKAALQARLPGGAILTCNAPACTGALQPWWSADRRSVRFLRREGWGNASTAIYEWTLKPAAVRRLYLTEDVLADCAPEVETLVCLREASSSPRRLERLDLTNGARALLFDPNPEFPALRLGSVRRLHWRNSYGLESVGDLILPVGYRAGQRYPLVVVQYDTRGFLRGGTGDEYPIQAFANRGYAVLSVRRPTPIGIVRGGRTFDEVARLDLDQFADRRSALSSIEEGVRLVISQGIADPARIGITGLSDGATQTISALIHSSLFAAAAMSSCCIDTMLPARAGPATARMFYAAGFPLMTDRNEAFWRELSLSLNARRIRIPILLQVTDGEYLGALESYTALREVGTPIDMFVFPDEYHLKWQPAHRLAIYRRSLDWFDYWLLGIRSTDPDRQAELRHWDALRPPSTRGK